jgi:predicted short-subunit dehydrogenase-like oxidoreductase (DUF2520 family)
MSFCPKSKIEGYHMKFNIIGAGRLGKNIALALSSAQIASVQSIVNRSVNSSERSCHEIGSGTFVSNIEDLPSANITWITTNDDSIRSIVSILAERAQLNPESLVIHCSGVLNSALLEPLKAQGCFIASFHPLKAFRTGYVDANAFDKVECVVEGDEKACRWLRHSFTALGSNIITIKPDAKVAYHAAACMASNYLVTLASCSEQLLLQAGLTAEQAQKMIGKLMQGNLNNLQETKLIAEALTGPLMRGDKETLSLHLQAIANPILLNFYKAAGLATLPLTQLPNDKKQSIANLLRNAHEISKSH